MRAWLPDPPDPPDLPDPPNLPDLSHPPDLPDSPGKPQTMDRRHWLGAAASVVALAISRRGGAMGRIPVGGEMTFYLPYDTSSLDPHDLFDPMVALVGHGVFDTVFRLDAAGRARPCLADGMPQQHGTTTRVRLRAGLQSGRGHTLDARDLVESIRRAKASRVRAAVQGLPDPTLDASDARVVVFRHTTAQLVAQVLASPMLPLLSRRSTATHPDATGAFVARPSAQELVLERNPRAARGPAFLRRVRIIRATSLQMSLRQFEARQADVGWLGSGLYRPRDNTTRFDFGPLAWVILRTGREAGPLHQPGQAQRLLQSIETSRMGHLGLGNLSNLGNLGGLGFGARPQRNGAGHWSGPPCRLLCLGRSVHLVEIAHTLASIMSCADGEVQALAVSRAELAAKRASGAFGLMVDVVRPIGPPGWNTVIALTSAQDVSRAEALVREAPRLEMFDPKALGRNLHFGVIGTLQTVGAVDARFKLVRSTDDAGWDLADSYIK